MKKKNNLDKNDIHYILFFLVATSLTLAGMTVLAAVSLETQNFIALIGAGLVFMNVYIIFVLAELVKLRRELEHQGTMALVGHTFPWALKKLEELKETKE